MTLIDRVDRCIDDRPVYTVHSLHRTQLSRQISQNKTTGDSLVPIGSMALNCYYEGRSKSFAT